MQPGKSIPKISKSVEAMEAASNHFGTEKVAPAIAEAEAGARAGAGTAIAGPGKNLHGPALERSGKKLDLSEEYLTTSTEEKTSEELGAAGESQPELKLDDADRELEEGEKPKESNSNIGATKDEVVQRMLIHAKASVKEASKSLEELKMFHLGPKLVCISINLVRHVKSINTAVNHMLSSLIGFWKYK